MINIGKHNVTKLYEKLNKEIPTAQDLRAGHSLPSSRRSQQVTYDGSVYLNVIFINTVWLYSNKHSCSTTPHGISTCNKNESRQSAPALKSWPLGTSHIIKQHSRHSTWRILNAYTGFSLVNKRPLAGLCLRCCRVKANIPI